MNRQAQQHSIDDLPDIGEVIDSDFDHEVDNDDGPTTITDGQAFLGDLTELFKKASTNADTTSTTRQIKYHNMQCVPLHDYPTFHINTSKHTATATGLPG